MKKNICLICCFLCIFSLTVLAGCSSDDAEKMAVCFVVGRHANSQGLNMNSPLVQDTIYSTIRHYGFIGIVSVDGSPEIVHGASYDINERYKTATSDKLDMDARAKASDIINGMQYVAADDPEADYLEALRLAVRSLSSLEGYGAREIIVIGTGLSTTGVLDFNNNLISADPTVIVEMLKEKSEIPDFTGITVYWQQMGDVMAPQEKLTSEQNINLQNIYKALVEAGGGTFFFNEMVAVPSNSDSQLPDVTPVDLPDGTPIYFEPEALDENEETVLDKPMILTDEQVTFVGDKAEYLHPEKAMETLRPIAEYLIRHPLISILLAGTTAGDTDSDFTMSLSRERAEAVKKSLVELGVEENRIISVGLGSAKDPWHIWGVGVNSAAASSNRKVVVMDAASEKAVNILNS